MIYYLIMLLSVVVASFSQILLKLSANKHHKSIKKEYFNPLVICGYFLLALSTIFTIIAFKGIPYSSGPVIESLGYIFVVILSCLILKEKISLNVVIGNIVIIVGVIIFYI